MKSRVKQIFPRKSLTPILLIGEGHGFENAKEGLFNSEINLNFISNNSNQFLSLREIETWVRKTDGVVISSAYRFKIPKYLVESFTFLNIHYALFPKYRGLHSVVWAMLNNEKYTGVTFHKMDAGFDSGPILYQHRVPIQRKTSWEIMQECDNYVKENIRSIICKFLKGNLSLRAQKQSTALYVGKRNLEDCRVNWNTWDSIFFQRALLALVPPYPRPYFTYKNRRYDISKAEILHVKYIEIPGHVVNIDHESVWIKLTDGVIKVFEIEYENIKFSANKIITELGVRLGETI